jgi:hypothetical protein
VNQKKKEYLFKNEDISFIEVDEREYMNYRHANGYSKNYRWCQIYGRNVRKKGTGKRIRFVFMFAIKEKYDNGFGIGIIYSKETNWFKIETASRLRMRNILKKEHLFTDINMTDVHAMARMMKLRTL